MHLSTGKFLLLHGLCLWIVNYLFESLETNLRCFFINYFIYPLLFILFILCCLFYTYILILLFYSGGGELYINRIIGIFPIMWLALALNAPRWAVGDYAQTHASNIPESGPNSVAPGSPETQVMSVCTFLYVIGMQSWYRPQCRLNGPDNILYASIIINEFIIYAVLRLFMRWLQDTVSGLCLAYTFFSLFA